MIGNVKKLTSTDFIIMEYYCKLFKPFKEVTVELSTEKGVSISKVIVLTNALLTHIKKIKHEIGLPKSIETMIVKMEQNSEKRFYGVEDNPVFAEATLLDPRLKKKKVLAMMCTTDVLIETLSKEFLIQLKTNKI